jgi:hypothetical protein
MLCVFILSAHQGSIVIEKVEKTFSSYILFTEQLT